LALPSVGLTLTLLAGVAAAAGVTVAVHHWPITQSAAIPSPGAPDHLDAQPAQVAVVDGGTLRLQNRVVRLLGVDPPSRGTTCKASDGTGFDCGAAATNALAALVQQTPVACRLSGHDDMGRPYAICEASGTELNQAVVAAGWGRADDLLPALKGDEATARAQRRGLWAAERDVTW
jgi:endonuclease YncB( thermonuclease family)